jgi:protein SCO1/2
LIFFGYTHCPDVCPVTLTKYKQIKDQLGDQADGVRFVFITVDPERDTPEILGKHVANYDPGFIALTGSRAELEPVWKNYGVYQARSETESAAGYLVDHTTRIYAIDTRELAVDLRFRNAFGGDPEGCETFAEGKVVKRDA